MTLKKIKVGKWYRTNGGAIGVCVQAGGCFPPAVRLQVHFPYPMDRWFKPREIECEVPEPAKEEK